MPPQSDGQECWASGGWAAHAPHNQPRVPTRNLTSLYRDVQCQADCRVCVCVCVQGWHAGVDN